MVDIQAEDVIGIQNEVTYWNKSIFLKRIINFVFIISIIY